MEYQEFQSNSELVLSPSPRDQKLIDQLDCGPTKCTHMACTVGPLRKRESVVFRIYSRLWSSTISRLSHHQYEISSRLVSVVTKLPHNVDPSFLDIKSKTGMILMYYILKHWRYIHYQDGLKIALNFCPVVKALMQLTWILSIFQIFRKVPTCAKFLFFELAI